MSGFLIDDLVPWNSEPESRKNPAHREKVAELLDTAHAFHMKFLAIADEFSYHPTLMEEFRRLFGALPGLGGVRIRTGELTRVTGTYRPLVLSAV